MSKLHPPNWNHGHSLDMDPASQKLNVVKWLEVTRPVPQFGIM